MKNICCLPSFTIRVTIAMNDKLCSFLFYIVNDASIRKWPGHVVDIMIDLIIIVWFDHVIHMKGKTSRISSRITIFLAGWCLGQLYCFWIWWSQWSGCNLKGIFSSWRFRTPTGKFIWCQLMNYMRQMQLTIIPMRTFIFYCCVWCSTHCVLLKTINQSITSTCCSKISMIAPISQPITSARCPAPLDNVNAFFTLIFFTWIPLWVVFSWNNCH